MSHLLDAAIYVTMGFGLGFILGGIMAAVTDCWENTTKNPKNPETVDTPVIIPQEEEDNVSVSIYHSHETLATCTPADVLPEENTPVFTHELVTAIADMLDNLPPKAMAYDTLSDDELREYAYSVGVPRTCKKRETILKKLSSL